MRAVLVSHTHWDREWYRTFQAFRARLVDAVDRVLDLCRDDTGYHFLLDGQSVVLEDYLAIRPEREEELRVRCAEGRLALGPWYVQPDSLLPSGEAHVRNLLLGRSVGERVGPVSRVGYTPDSFGHPAQLPQILSGFGVQSFVFWRGLGDEADQLPAEFDWVAPDGSRVVACHLGKGYFCAATPPHDDLQEAAVRIAERARELAQRARADAILLMNGIDHALPEPRTAELAQEVARAGGFPVERGLLEGYVERVLASPNERPSFSGELVGARVAPLLPGVWSTRSWIKLRNRRCEAALEGWAEPWAALVSARGGPDERPSLVLAWKELLRNQAHDSICGCSRDSVHEQMRARYDAAEELADETTQRCLERLAGLGPERLPPFRDDFELAVANPSPHPRTDVVRFPLDPHPAMVPHPDPRKGLHPLYLQDLSGARFTVDDVPARLVPSEDPGRPVLIPERRAYDLEFVAREVPALGLRRVRVRREGADPGEATERVEPGGPDAVIESDGVEIRVREDGRFDARFGERRFVCLGGLEDVGDRGDTYDFDAVGEATEPPLAELRVWRSLHPSGIRELRVERCHLVAASLEPCRTQRSREQRSVRLVLELRVAEGVRRADLRVRLEDPARDHRLRLLFPVGARVSAVEAATTFDVLCRPPGARSHSGWVQAPTPTFPQQGFVHAAGLTVGAPGLPEAEVIEGDPSVVAITLQRSVGNLSRQDLHSRPGPAGPGTATPGAQCPDPLEARLFLLPGLDPAAARAAELGLRAVSAGAAALLPFDEPCVALEPSALVLSALKPAEQGDGFVLRILNPTDRAERARVTLGFEIGEVACVRLDETACEADLRRQGRELAFSVPPHALRSVLVRPR